MRGPWIPAIVVLMMLVAIVAPAEALNLLANPGFESGALGPWFQDQSFSSGEDWNVTNSTAHTGTFSATDTGNKSLRQNFAATATSAITQVSFFAKHDNSNGSALAVDFFYSDSTHSEFIVNTTDTNFDFFDVTSDLAVGKQLTGLSLFGNSFTNPLTGGITRTFLDDLTVSTAGGTVPEPSTLVLLAVGLAGAVARRRARRNR